MRDYDNIPLRNLIRAKAHRREPSQAERRLWYKLRNNQLGAKFRRQHAIENYIVDFVCLEHKLIIEIDGPSHGDEGQQEYDSRRTAALQNRGYRILRFTNGEVLRAMDHVLASISKSLLTA